jgi:hypothetical protein
MGLKDFQHILAAELGGKQIPQILSILGCHALLPVPPNALPRVEYRQLSIKSR